MSDPDLTPHQQRLVQMWEEHLATEFETKTVDDTMKTMIDEPYVNHVPVMTGGVGHDHLKHFYGKHFIPSVPDDFVITPVSRTVGTSTIADEFIVSFTHTKQIDWFIPGVPPTGRKVKIAKVVIVNFEGDKLKSEHIYWDHASLLAQLGLLDPDKLPICGMEAAEKVLDPKSHPSNLLMKRTIDDPEL